jgi:hypothetical protein
VKPNIDTPELRKMVHAYIYESEMVGGHGFRAWNKLVQFISTIVPVPPKDILAWHCVNTVTGKMLYTDSESEMINMRDCNTKHWDITPLVSPSYVHKINAKAMAYKFCGWPLPKSFSPDCGISFDGRKDDKWNKNKTWPIGTNLFTVDQAAEMFEHCFKDLKIDTKNQCDGCMAGHELVEGIHRVKGLPSMKCEKDKYHG